MCVYIKQTSYSLKLTDLTYVTNRFLQLPLQFKISSDVLATKMATSVSHFFHLEQIHCYLLTLQIAHTDPELFYPQCTYIALISADGNHTYSPSRKIPFYI